jgi:hypothetical protein
MCVVMTSPHSHMAGYIYQLSSDKFDFDIIKDTHNFRTYQKHAMRAGLVRDICKDEYDDVAELAIDQYLHVNQKSPTWFRLRAAADDTASSVGKKIKGPTMYPTYQQVAEYWRDHLGHKPFEITQTTAGHMKWGCGYEDPALVHFAVDNRLTVTQVGTIHLPLSYILGLTEGYYTDSKILRHRDYLMTVANGAHLLVSPDGLVYNGDTLVGMLEIKCISPFHHVEEDGYLSWVDDMETRQWRHPGQIPFVYIVQICIQAISGLHRLGMSDRDTMWFIRWSPEGFSEFRVEFSHLIRVGLVAIMLYFRLKTRLVETSKEIDIDNIEPFPYNTEESELADVLYHQYMALMGLMTHRYVAHGQLYPEFRLYRRCTEYHRFKVPI